MNIFIYIIYFYIILRHINTRKGNRNTSRSSTSCQNYIKRTLEHELNTIIINSYKQSTRKHDVEKTDLKKKMYMRNDKKVSHERKTPYRFLLEKFITWIKNKDLGKIIYDEIRLILPSIGDRIYVPQRYKFKSNHTKNKPDSSYKMKVFETQNFANNPYPSETINIYC